MGYERYRGLFYSIALGILVRFAVLLISISVIFFAEPLHLKWLPADEKAYEAHKALLDYLKGSITIEEAGERASLTKEEARHMEDVKERVDAGRVLLLLIVALVFGFSLLKPRAIDVKRAFLFSGVFGIISSTGLFVVPYQAFFDAFHRVLFEKGTWLFPLGTTLAKLYGGGFFQTAFKAVFSIDLATSIAIALIAMLSMKYKKENLRTKAPP